VSTTVGKRLNRATLAHAGLSDNAISCSISWIGFASPRSWHAGVIGFCRRPLGTVGLALVGAAAGLSADWIAPYSPTSSDFSVMTEPPSWAHLMRPAAKVVAAHD
jgi:hypothetical protein